MQVGSFSKYMDYKILTWIILNCSQNVYLKLPSSKTKINNENVMMSGFRDYLQIQVQRKDSPNGFSVAVHTQRRKRKNH